VEVPKGWCEMTSEEPDKALEAMAADPQLQLGITPTDDATPADPSNPGRCASAVGR